MAAILLFVVLAILIFSIFGNWDENTQTSLHSEASSTGPHSDASSRSERRDNPNDEQGQDAYDERDKVKDILSSFDSEHDRVFSWSEEKELARRTKIRVNGLEFDLFDSDLLTNREKLEINMYFHKYSRGRAKDLELDLKKSQVISFSIDKEGKYYEVPPDKSNVLFWNSKKGLSYPSRLITVFSEDAFDSPRHTTLGVGNSVLYDIGSINEKDIYECFPMLKLSLDPSSNFRLNFEDGIEIYETSTRRVLTEEKYKKFFRCNAHRRDSADTFDRLNKRLKDLRYYSKSFSPINVFDNGVPTSKKEALEKPIFSIDLHGFTRQNGRKAINLYINASMKCNIPVLRFITGSSGQVMDQLVTETLEDIPHSRNHGYIDVHRSCEHQWISNSEKVVYRSNDFSSIKKYETVEDETLVESHDPGYLLYGITMNIGSWREWSYRIIDS